MQNEPITAEFVSSSVKEILNSYDFDTANIFTCAIDHGNCGALSKTEISHIDDSVQLNDDEVDQNCDCERGKVLIEQMSCTSCGACNFTVALQICVKNSLKKINMWNTVLKVSKKFYIVDKFCE